MPLVAHGIGDERMAPDVTVEEVSRLVRAAIAMRHREA